jgi:hypothetical protein
LQTQKIRDMSTAMRAPGNYWLIADLGGEASCEENFIFTVSILPTPQDRINAAQSTSFNVNLDIRNPYGCLVVMSLPNGTLAADVEARHGNAAYEQHEFDKAIAHYRKAWDLS